MKHPLTNSNSKLQLIPFALFAFFAAEIIQPAHADEYT